MKIKNKIWIKTIFLPIACISLNASTNFATEVKKDQEEEIVKQPIFDWRKNKNNFILSPVRYQIWNICWAYSVIGVAETNILKNGLYASPNTLDLSENNLAYITKNRDKFSDPLNNTKFDNYSTNFWNSGGSTKDAAYTLMQWRGLAKETNEFQKNNFNLPFFPEEFIQINNNDSNSIKKYVVKNGAVGFSFIAGDATKYYNANETYNNVKRYWHAATIIGWDDTIPREKFGPKTKQNGAWIVKNSWGTNYMDNGYMYLSYDSKINNTFTLNFASPDKYKNNYYFDGYLKNIYKPGQKSAAVTFKAKKTSNENIEQLKSINVGFEGKNVDVNVKVFLNNDDSEINPNTLNLNKSKLIASKTRHFEDGGLRIIELDKPIELDKGQYFSIVATVKNNDNTAEILFSDEEFSSLDFTYIKKQNKWINSQNIFNGVARIKAFTSELYDKNSNRINDKDLKYVDVTLDNDFYKYGLNDPKNKININVKMGSKILKENHDYKVNYEFVPNDNDHYYKDYSKIGYGKIKITGLNEFLGSRTKVFYTPLVGLYPKIQNKDYQNNPNEFIIEANNKIQKASEINYGQGWEVESDFKLSNGNNLVNLVYTAKDAKFYRKNNAIVTVRKNINTEENKSITNNEENKKIIKDKSINKSNVKQKIDNIKNNSHYDKKDDKTNTKMILIIFIPILIFVLFVFCALRIFIKKFKIKK
ncbi:hypothetical protein JXZ92_02720 [Mycoplasma sp. CSL10137]|uniref:C1 family peptidase n=1 Tax=Mycoplasma sp. CSL10137 TaxID=2813824 RepID=UPI00197B11CF|nr:C1 family peptidase [Mycoplasma sp. CSL10137]MBN4083723.1 hypothetical protein [Mycoplasma sp. CSL10137]